MPRGHRKVIGCTVLQWVEGSLVGSFRDDWDILLSGQLFELIVDV